MSRWSQYNASASKQETSSLLNYDETDRGDTRSILDEYDAERSSTYRVKNQPFKYWDKDCIRRYHADDNTASKIKENSATSMFFVVWINNDKHVF